MATEDVPFTLAVPPFTDPDEDLLEYSVGVASPDAMVADLPAWLEFDTATRLLSGTPLEGDTPSVLTLVVTATDDGDPPASAEVRFHAGRRRGQRRSPRPAQARTRPFPPPASSPWTAPEAGTRREIR